MGRSRAHRPGVVAGGARRRNLPRVEHVEDQVTLVHEGPRHALAVEPQSESCAVGIGLGRGSDHPVGTASEVGGGIIELQTRQRKDQADAARFCLGPVLEPATGRDYDA